MANCKGISVTARLAYAQAHHGEAGLRALIDALSPEHRKLIDARILPHAWVPMELFIALNVAADQLFGKGDLALCEEMGAWSAEKNLSTVFRIFYRLGTPMFIFGKAARLWSAHYDTGRLEPTSPADNEVRLLLHATDNPHRAHCLSVLGWARRSIEISGGEVLTSEEARCRTRGDPHCELLLRWK